MAQAHAVVLLEKVEDPHKLKSMSAVIESQKQLEDVVENLLSQVTECSRAKGLSLRPLTRKTLPKIPPGICEPEKADTSPANKGKQIEE